jgi:hypothetical protein
MHLAILKLCVLCGKYFYAEEANVIDLRKLMLMIQEQKQMNANLALEFDCDLDHDDPKPLIKVINYIINYLAPLSENAIEISLNAYREGYMLSFALFTDLTEVPPLSDQLDQALQTYNASLQLKHEEGKYIQLIITFE